MKIVITGSNGHIGSHLIRELPNHFPSAEIILIDNLMTQRFSSLFQLPSHGNYKFICADVAKDPIDEYVKNAYVVIHLAAITDASSSFERPGEVEENNFNATKKVADSCLISNSRFILISSTSVYGSQESIVSEDCPYDMLLPQSPYAKTKLIEESYIMELSKNNLKSVICRFGTIFGPSIGIRFHTAVNKFCWQAVMGDEITVWKTALDQKRPYLDLNDAVKALIYFIKTDLFDGRIYNVCTENYTVRTVVETINSFVPKIKIKYVDHPIMNQLSYEVICSNLNEKGFIFSGDLQSGIGKTIELLRNSNKQ
jgi:UDP-glucose 4-epimerase